MPSSKSHTIRALLIAGAADGTSTVHNALDSADAQSCIRALEAFNVQVDVIARSATGIDLQVSPPSGGMWAAGTGGPADHLVGDPDRPHAAPPAAPPATAAAYPPAEPVAIDVGNSGTTLYLLTALAALHPRGVCFDGDASIRRRSAAHLLSALRDLGAGVVPPAAEAQHAAPTVTGTGAAAAPECAPYCVCGPLTAGRHITVESPTSQYLSALLLTAPLIPAKGPSAPSGTASDPTSVRTNSARAGAPAPDTTITVALLNEHPYVDMTCWWLDRQQITYYRDGYARFRIPAGQHYRPHATTLPGDYSSATFWFCAAAITGHSVTVSGIAPDDVQGDRAVLDILATLGCQVQWSTGGTPTNPVHTVTVSGTPQRGGTFDLNAMPDALPALAVVACFAPAPIALTNVPQARQKETDRIAVMAMELEKLGATVRELPDGLEIEPKVLRGGTVHSHGDHRIAMAFAVGALAAAGPITITDAGAAAVTYPAFYDDLARLAPGAV